MSSPWDTIVIGGGLSGLSAAVTLARADQRTLLLEQRAATGGLAAPGRFDTGAVAPPVRQDNGMLPLGLLRHLRLAKHGLTAKHAVPALHVLLQEGGCITVRSNASQTEASIARHHAADAKNYRRYAGLAQKVAPALARLLQHPGPANGIRALPLILKGLRWWKMPAMHELLRLAPMSAQDFLDQWFVTDSLKAALAIPAFQAAWGGPFYPFGALHILIQEALSSHFVTGGMAAVATSLERAAVHHGVTIQTGNRAERILLASDGTVRGVQLADGATIAAPSVIAACSPRVVYQQLIEHRHLDQGFLWQARHLKSRGTTAHLALLLNSVPEALAPRARCAPGIEALEQSFDKMKQGEIPEAFALEIEVHADPPALSVLAHFVPHTVQGGWTSEARRELAHRILAPLKPHLPGPVLSSRLLTPEDLELDYQLPGGHLYHVERSPDQMLAQPLHGWKPPAKGLYLASSGTTHGGGSVCTSGLVAARALLRAKKQSRLEMRRTRRF